VQVVFGHAKLKTHNPEAVMEMPVTLLASIYDTNPVANQPRDKVKTDKFTVKGLHMLADGNIKPPRISAMPLGTFCP